MRYDRARSHLDRHPDYILAAPAPDAAAHETNSSRRNHPVARCVDVVHAQKQAHAAGELSPDHGFPLRTVRFREQDAGRRAGRTDHAGQPQVPARTSARSCRAECVSYAGR